MTYPVGHSV